MPETYAAWARETETAYRPSGNFNAEKCAAYLRWMGIDVSDEVEAAWREQEKDERKRRKAHYRELKRSCGHFRRHETTVHTDDGSFKQTWCSDCRTLLLILSL